MVAYTRDIEKDVRYKFVVKKEDIIIGIKVILVASANVLFLDNKILAYLLIFSEVIMLGIDALQKKWIDYFGNYILFCGLSIEFANLTNSSVIYSFKEFRVLGINLGILTLVPIALHYLFKMGCFDKIKKNACELWGFAKSYTILIIISAAVGLLLIVVNDNNMVILHPFKIYIEELYQRGALPLMIIFIFVVMVVREKKGVSLLEKYLVGTLCGAVISMVVSLVSEKFGNYGGVNTLIATNNVRWLPLMLIFPLYKKYKKNVFIIFVGLLGAFLLLKYNATGKNIIMYICVPLIYIFVNLKRRKYAQTLLLLLMCPIIATIGIFIMGHFQDASVLFNSKMRQVVSLFSMLFNPATALDNMLDSPKVRILEFINITNEYIKKPYLFIFGKGIGGTILQGQLVYDLASFSKEELSAGLIYNVHESLNKLYLSNGLLGLGFFVSTVFAAVRNVSKTPWILIGVYWFLISLGHSITMSAFGLSCLLYGMYECDARREVTY